MKTYDNKGTNHQKSGYKYIVIIKIFIKTIMQHYYCTLHRSKYIEEVEFKHKYYRETKVVPKDVREGQFAVVAVKCDKPKRFVVELKSLTNPDFLRLLKKAGEEYGFKNEGAITIPCEPHELQMILQQMKHN